MQHRSFGQPNPALTRKINALARADRLGFTDHAEEQMDEDGFDHRDVKLCLSRGTAYGPELHNGMELRANVCYGGNLRIRVAVGVDGVDEQWDRLTKLRVITVMKDK